MTKPAADPHEHDHLPVEDMGTIWSPPPEPPKPLPKPEQSRRLEYYARHPHEQDIHPELWWS